MDSTPHSRLRILLIAIALLVLGGWLLFVGTQKFDLAGEHTAFRSALPAVSPRETSADEPVTALVTTVAGRVTLDGEPTSARVEIRPEREDFEAPGSPVFLGLTRPDGAFEARGLPPGEYRVSATGRDDALGATRFQIAAVGVRVEIEVRLATGGHTLRGRARWRDGRPFQGLLIARERVLDLAGSDGAFEFAGLVPWEPGFFGFPDRLLAVIPGRLQTPSAAFTLPHHGEFEFVVDAETSPLTGRVLALPGRTPVQGAVLSATVSAFGADHEARARTDAEGRFSLPVKAGEVELEMTAEGFAPGYRTLRAEEREVEFLLVPGGTLTGVVVDAADGEPVPGVAVSLSPGGETRTGAAGRFGFPIAPCGKLRVSAASENWVSAASFEGYLGPGESRSIELRVRRAATIPGRVVDGHGKGISGATVAARCRGEVTPVSSCATDADGRFLVRGLTPEVEITLSAEAPGLPTARIEGLVPMDLEPEDVVFTLPDPTWIDVTVLEARTGAPVPEARVSAMGRVRHRVLGDRCRLTCDSVETDESGFVRVGPLPAGPLEIEIVHRDYLWQEGLALGAGPPGLSGRRQLTVRLKRGASISGRVLGADGAPVARGMVWIRPRWDGERHRPVPFENGAFRILGLADGTYRLRATTTIRGSYMRGVVETPVGRHDVIIRLEERPESTEPDPICVRLLDSAGRPVLWARARALARDGGLAPDSEVVLGEMRMDPSRWSGVSYGSRTRWRIVIHAARTVDGEPLGCAMTRLLSKDDLPFEVRLSPARDIVGCVLHHDGRAASGVPVTAHPAASEHSPPVSEASTDDAGRFRLGGLGPGEYRIEIAPGAGYLPPDPVLAGVGAGDVRLILRESPVVSITVLDWRDRPVPGARVRIWTGRRARARTDRTGVARIEGLDLEYDEAYLEVIWPPGRDDLATCRIEDWVPGDETVRLERRYGLAGFVRDEQGEAVAGATVDVASKEPRCSVRAVTRADGSFRVNGLPEGACHATVRIGEADPEETGCSEIPLRAGTEDCVLTIRRPCDLVVRVVGGRDAGARVVIRRRGSDPRRGKTIPADGLVRIAALDPTSVYELSIDRVAGAEWKYPEEIPGRAGEIRIALVGGKSISGRVIMPGGYDLVHALRRLEITGPDDFRCEGCVRMEDWTYEIAGLPDGEYEVRFDGDRDYRGAVRVRAGQTADLILERK